MTIVFYIAAIVALLCTLRVITCSNAVHALLYFVVSLFAVALIFFVLGAPFVAALEVITYAGAIMVLFIFVVMLLNLGPESSAQERALLKGPVWIGPSLLSLVLAIELIYVLAQGNAPEMEPARMIGPKEVGAVLLGPYVLGVELASMLLLAGLVGAFHIGRRATKEKGGA